MLADDAIIPGMGPEDKVEFTESLTADSFIPGLELDPSNMSNRDHEKKVPYSKPIPRNFQAQWSGRGRMEDAAPNPYDELSARDIKDTTGMTHEQISENTIEGMLASGVLTTMDPQAIVGILVYGRFIRVHPDSRLMVAVRQGPEYLNKYIDAGKLDELRDVVSPHDRDGSRSPTLEGRDTSPPSKKSRFEVRQHNPQAVFVKEMLSLKKPFLPCLLQLKEQLYQQQQQEMQQQQQMHQQHQQQQQQQNQPPPLMSQRPFGNNFNGNNGPPSLFDNSNNMYQNGGGGGHMGNNNNNMNNNNRRGHRGSGNRSGGGRNNNNNRNRNNRRF